MFNFKSLLRDPKCIISVESLKKDIDVSGVGVVVDVRTQEEYAKGHVPNSISIPFNELQLKIASLVPLKTTRIFCYSTDGEKSYESVKFLLGMGYQLAYSVKGGYKAWFIKGYPSVSV